MSDGRVSKKMNIATACISGVTGMATKAEHTLYFAIVICVMFCAYLTAQVLIDRKNDVEKEEE